MAPGIHVDVAIDFALSVLLWRDNGGGASLLQFGPYPIDVESLVREQGFEVDRLDQRGNTNAVMALTRQKNKAHEIAERVHQRDNLRRQPAPRAADGLIASPPFAPVPCLWTRMMVPSTMAYSKSGSPDKL